MIALPPSAGWSDAKRAGHTLALFLGGLVTLSLALLLFFPQLTATQHLASGRAGAIDLPWRFGEIGSGNRLDVHMPVHVLGPRRWRIVPDDRLVSLTIDGRPVPLDGVRPGGLIDWQHGFEIDLSPWLRVGDNEVELTIDNAGGPGGVALRPVLGWRIILLAAALLPWLFALARVFRLRRSVTGILSGVLLVLCLYWAATPWNVRGYDVKFRGETGHFDYVVYVADHGRLPRSDRGWEYYQPPLYYVGGALALWPSCVIHSIRIGNDAALYASAALATYFMFLWWRSGRRLHLLGMAMALTAALLSKSSAAALVAAAGALLLLRLLRRRRWRHLRGWADCALASAFVTIGVLLSIGRNIWYRLHGQVSSWLVGSVGTLDANLRVPNRLRDYVPLDIPVFLTSPWVSSRDDATGRTNFWNYLLRSSLTGEFGFEGDLRAYTGMLWGGALLALLLLLALRLHPLRWRIEALWREAPWIFLSVAWVASVLVSRAAYPYSCQGDFRFIVPVLVPFVLACVRRSRLTRGLLAVIAVTSAAFFATL